jgi:hypothetical protein
MAAIEFVDLARTYGQLGGWALVLLGYSAAFTVLVMVTSMRRDID